MMLLIFRVKQSPSILTWGRGVPILCWYDWRSVVVVCTEAGLFWFLGNTCANVKPRYGCPSQTHLGKKRMVSQCPRQVPVPQAVCQFPDGALVSHSPINIAAVLTVWGMSHHLGLSTALRPALLMAWQ